MKFDRSGMAVNIRKERAEMKQELAANDNGKLTPAQTVLVRGLKKMLLLARALSDQRTTLILPLNQSSASSCDY